MNMSFRHIKLDNMIVQYRGEINPNRAPKQNQVLRDITENSPVIRENFTYTDRKNEERIMDYIIQVKEEPMDETYEVIHLGTELHDRRAPDFYQIEQNTISERSSIIDGNGDNVLFIAEHIKSEPDNKNKGSNSEDHDKSISSRKKTRMSSSLLKILNASPQHNGSNVTMVTDEKSETNRKRSQPTLYGLLNGTVPPIPQTLVVTDKIENDVHITHITAPSSAKSGSSSTLQKMLASPYSGKSPLLSSMLKTPSRTDSTIDSVFSTPTANSNQNLQPKRKLPVLLKMGPDIPLKKNSNDRQNLSTINESVTKFTEANLTKINPIIDKTLLPDPHPGKIVPTESSIVNCSPQNNGVPAGLQTDFINRWTEVITQKVIAEFSKDVNATLNSFVKKAIIDSIKDSSTNPVPIVPAPTSASCTEKPVPGEENQVSSLASCLLQSLADKVNGCGIKDIAKGLNVEDDINLINVCQNIQKSSQDIAKLLASSTMSTASESDHSNTVTFHEQIPTNSKPTVQKLEIEKELLSSTNNSAPTVPPEEVKKLVSNLIGLTNKSNVNRTKPETPVQEAPIEYIIIPSENDAEETKPVETSSVKSQPVPVSPIITNIKHMQDKDGKFLIFSCKICGKRFQHHGTLSVHMRTHVMESGTSEFKCDICGKLCTAKRYLDIHMRTHQKRGSCPVPTKQLVCETCQGEFTSEENLLIHKRMHLVAYLRNHKKFHTGTYKDIMDDDDEEEITSEEESKDNSDEEMDKADAYSDMIMHIATDIDGSPESRQFGTEETDNSTDMLEFVNASQDYADNFTDTDIKTEPIGFNELKSRLGDNKYINFDPSIVKVEPEEIIDESALAENPVVSSRVNVEFNTSVVKCEPLNS
ncbi:KRAB [Mytilus edulis]|uniref:KRAB n=1 Tax=Mytilus edulis TaxID=6550 RepID=A0A8S3U618_MYTED|nr:KRAB [Mytilus edulis]